MAAQFIYPDWPAPENVRAFSTTRNGGCSTAPWHSLNLGSNTGDDSSAIADNRARLRRSLPAEPAWLEQVHGSAATEIGTPSYKPEADAAISRHHGQVCAVLTADCLPLLLSEQHGNAVAAVHCGWRGLAAGVVECCVQALGYPPGQLLAWMGPAIGPDHYEVGMDVFEAFTGVSAEAGSAFTPGKPGRWQLDLYELVRLELEKLGVGAVYGGGFCTYSEVERFFSFRRDGVTGRQASLIWME